MDVFVWKENGKYQANGWYANGWYANGWYANGGYADKEGWHGGKARYHTYSRQQRAGGST